MSLLESLAFLLSDMGFAQLVLAFIVVGGYSLAINGSLSSAVRSGAASAAFAAGAAFAAITTSWTSGVVFLAIVVAAMAAFAGAAWLVSAALGLGAETGRVPVNEERAEAWTTTAQPARTLSPSTAVRSL
jgi:hypothetical protein